LPLSIQQSKSAEYMKSLRPYIAQIQEKFKNNENAKNQAVGRLYQDAEQNPLAGCLTSLAQLPIFLGLYRGIRLLALDGELKEPFLWIPSLQGPVTAETDYRGLDWLVKGWTANPDPAGFPLVPSLGWETTLAFLAMPVILVLLQSATMRVLSPPNPADDSSVDEKTKETMDRTQTILKFLPLMIGFFSLQVPAGLTIYWFTSNIFTLSSSLGVRAYFAANPPQINLPDYWDSALAVDKEFADMTPEERRQAMEAGIRVGPTMEELKDESKFHFYVDRRNAQFLAADAPRSTSLPSDMQAWVDSGPPRRPKHQDLSAHEPSASAAAVAVVEEAAATAKSSA
jgi:YidC/Oxa1 family membrane protein insertase